LSETLLSIKNLTKTYPNGVQALKGVSFDVKKGEFLAVVGLSGSGKSTLLRCLNRLHDPTSGSIIFKNQDVAAINGIDVRNLRAQIGMIFQHFNLIPRHTVLSNVLMGKLASAGSLQSLFGMFSESDKKSAMEYLKLMGIADKAGIRADQLSGGQQQRVAIARTLTQSPEVLLADEPVASLDPVTSRVVMDYLKKINQELGITVICNLHHINLVHDYATRVIALKDGNIVFDGNPKDISEGSSWFKTTTL
jgi:phosphonate transport system ATP-binding protein